MLDSSGEVVETDETLEWSWEASLKTAIHIGVSLSEYEYMTPYELALHIEAYFERKELEHQTSITLVWLGEYYHRIKKLPPLKKVIDEVMGKEKKQMTDEQMLEKAKSLNALFGGIEIKETDNDLNQQENEIDSIQSGVN